MKFVHVQRQITTQRIHDILADSVVCMYVCVFVCVSKRIHPLSSSFCALCLFTGFIGLRSLEGRVIALSIY